MTKPLLSSGETHLDPVVYFGRLVSPDIQAIELVFADVNRLRDEAADGYFAFVTQPTHLTCGIVVLAENDLALWRINLTLEQPGAIGVAELNDCMDFDP